MIAIFYLISAFVLLWYASDKSVAYANKVSHVFGISNLFLGFIFMAIITGLPELLVAIQAILAGSAPLSIGDLIGSNFVNISLGLGIPAYWWGNILVDKNACNKKLLLLLLIIVILAILFLLPTVGIFSGILLHVTYGLSIWWLWLTKEPSERLTDSISAYHIEEKSAKLLFLKFLATIILVVIAAKLCISSALEIIIYFGLRPEIIGSTIFAFGTSLPEIALSFQAVRKKEYNLALGNVLGSNLTNITLFLGFLMLTTQESISLSIVKNIAPFLFISHGLVGYAILRKQALDKKDGIMLLCLYLIFIVYEGYNIRKTSSDSQQITQVRLID